MAQVIDGSRVTTTLSTRQALCERYLGAFAVRAEWNDIAEDVAFTQPHIEPYRVANVVQLARVRAHVSMWREGVRVWDVLRNREDHRRVRERTRAKIERAMTPVTEAKARLEDLKDGAIRPYLDWCLRNRNEGRYSVSVSR